MPMALMKLGVITKILVCACDYIYCPAQQSTSSYAYILYDQSEGCRLEH